MNRTDVHAPGSADFDPQAYDLIDVFDLHHDSGDHRDLNEFVAELAKRGVVQAPHSNGCGHCGQTNLRYVALLVREDVNEWIFVGQDCLIGRFQSQTKASFQALKKAAELARAKQAKKTAFLALVDANPMLAWATYADNIEVGIERDLADLAGQKVLGRDAKFLGTHAQDHRLASGTSFATNTLADIARKARTYGELSDKQIAFVARLVAEIEGKVADYRAKVAERNAKPQATLVVTGKRQLVEGVVLSRQERDSDWGLTWKLLIEQADGSKVWGTEPSAIVAEKGDTVRFTAAVSVSNDDQGFGFYSRPTKPEIVAHAVTEEVAA